MDLKLEAKAVKKEKVKIPNFEDKESQHQFKINTSETTIFTDCFENLQPVCQQSEQWLSHVKAHVKKAFKKIRIKSRKIKPSPADRLISQRNKFLKQGKTIESQQLDALIA